MEWRDNRASGHVQQVNGWVYKTIWRATRPLLCQRCGGPIPTGAHFTRGSGQRGEGHSTFCIACQPAHRSPYRLGHMGKGTPAAIDESCAQADCPLCDVDRADVAEFNERLKLGPEEWITCPRCGGAGIVTKERPNE